MRKLTIRILGALLAVMVLAGCTVRPDSTEPAVADDPTEATQPTQETVPHETQPVTEPVQTQDVAVQTPVGILLYPSDLAEHLDVRTAQGDVTVMTFVAVLEDREQALFDLRFSQVTAEGAAGMVQAEGKNVYMGFIMHDFTPDASWRQDQIDTVYAMQETLNVLMDQVTLAPVEDVPEAQDLVIATAYGDLNFPGRWEEQLKVEKPDADTVEFYGVLPGKEPQLLFTLRFGGDGALALTCRDGVRTAVSIKCAEPVFDGTWSQQEMDLIYAMQEDINYLTDALGQ